MPKEKLVRVVREIEYIGPESWVETTIIASVIGERSPEWLEYPRIIRQISINRSVVKEE